jgi:hypothetical protein
MTVCRSLAHFAGTRKGGWVIKRTDVRHYGIGGGRLGLPGVGSGQLLFLLAVGLVLAVMATARTLRKR